MNIINDVKEEVICVLCNLVLNDPITFPCDCLSCNEHLNDHFVIDNKISCPKCKQEFPTTKENFRTNKLAKNILYKESYLNKEEKKVKKDALNLLNQCEVSYYFYK